MKRGFNNTIFFFAFFAAVSATAMGGCALTSANAEDENFIVPPGKADNYFSVTAQEYLVEGSSTVTLETRYLGEDEETKMKRAKELIGYKHIVIEWFLNVYLREKSPDDDNSDYGGFRSMVKAGAYENLEITPLDDLTYSFKFRNIIGGTRDLLSILPSEDAGEGKRQFTLTMGKIGNTEMSRLEANNEWYRRSPWNSFDPSQMRAEDLEELVLTIEPEKKSTDAWIDYNRLYEDNNLTIAVHLGWDYHAEYHIQHSRTLYNWLVNSMGFTSPVGSYSEYNRRSSPLTRTFVANGREIRAEIQIFWGQPGTETDPDTDAGGIVLENDMIESLRTKDVIIYSGHSGFLYGFALANWRMTAEGDLDDSKIPYLDMPPDRYQLVVAEGCDTYAIGQAFWRNPNKADRQNLDIITTTSFSNASRPTVVQEVIRALIPSHGTHRPSTYSELLRKLDASTFWFTTMYGIHGIDSSPKVHPYADLSRLCLPCEITADCGAEGNQCTRLNNQERVCTAFCTDDTGCPYGYVCLESARSDGYIHSKQCVPATLSCNDFDPTPSGGRLIINEVLADPPMGLEGDANGDGVRCFRDDEFVEIVNAGDRDADISGYTIADGLRIRFTFPESTVVPAGKAVVVFGGGNPSEFEVTDTAQFFAASSGLALNNNGDTVTLADPHGNTVDFMTYGLEGGRDRSLTRAVDGDPDAVFIPHGGRGFSPGLRQDGTPF